MGSPPRAETLWPKAKPRAQLGSEVRSPFSDGCCWMDVAWMMIGVNKIPFLNGQKKNGLNFFALIISWVFWGYFIQLTMVEFITSWKKLVLGGSGPSEEFQWLISMVIVFVPKGLYTTPSIHGRNLWLTKGDLSYLHPQLAQHPSHEKTPQTLSILLVVSWGSLSWFIILLI